MGWIEYLKNSIGIQIVIGIHASLLFTFYICSTTERLKTSAATADNKNSIETIRLFKKIILGMLIGFTISVLFGVVLVVIRDGYFSVLHEIGAIAIGFIGAVVGGFLGLFTFRKPRT